MFDGREFGETIVGIVKEHLAASVTPILARLEALEQRPLPRDGKDADTEQIVNTVTARIDAAIGADFDGLQKSIDALVATQKPVDALRAEMATIAGELVERAVAAFPVPQDGKPGPTGERGEKGEPGRNGVDGINGRDGIGHAGATIDRDGHLVITLTDGTTKDVGPVVGRDGRHGTDGKDGAVGRDGVDGLPGADGKDGADGINGRDGTDGAHGAPGERGESGERGERGDKGDPGEPGRDGAAGLPGKDADLYAPDAIVDAIVIAAKMLAMQPDLVEIKGEDGIVLKTMQMPPQPILFQPTRKRMRTMVTKHDASGRIAEFEQVEVDD